MMHCSHPSHRDHGVPSRRGGEIHVIQEKGAVFSLQLCSSTNLWGPWAANHTSRSLLYVDVHRTAFLHPRDHLPSTETLPWPNEL